MKNGLGTTKIKSERTEEEHKERRFSYFRGLNNQSGGILSPRSTCLSDVKVSIVPGLMQRLTAA